MPTFRNASPVCLICNETVAVAKEYNLRRHHNTKHTNFRDSYPEQSEARKRKITESEVLKECMVTVVEELAPDKSMDRVIASVKQIPLSASTAANLSSFRNVA